MPKMSKMLPQLSFLIIFFPLFCDAKDRISKSCYAPGPEWKLLNCVRIYNSNSECYIPVNCDISATPYGCPGFCSVNTAILEYPCSVDYL